jgi:hypothetical protein
MVYFIQTGDGGYVKIGWTENEASLATRLISLQHANALRLSVIRVLDVERWAEFWLHGFFAEQRLIGEWFTFTEEMLSVVPPGERPDYQSVARLANGRLARGGKALYGGRWVSRLADALGVHHQTVRRWESGEVAIPGEMMDRVKGLLVDKSAELNDILEGE